MDVRKLVIVLCVVVVGAIALVLLFQRDEPGASRSRGNAALAEKLEASHGAALRSVEVKSLGVDPRTRDVVVVFAQGRPGRKPVGRLPGLAGASGCGEVDLGIEVGEKLTIWGDSKNPDFKTRADCVVNEVVRRISELRGGS